MILLTKKQGIFKLFNSSLSFTFFVVFIYLCSEGNVKDEWRIRHRLASVGSKGMIGSRFVGILLLPYKPCLLTDLLSNCPGARPREKPVGAVKKKKRRKKKARE